MNIQDHLRDLRRAYTLEQIAKMCDFSSKGHVHDVLTGRQKTVTFLLGMRIMDAHKKLMRKEKRATKELAADKQAA